MPWVSLDRYMQVSKFINPVVEPGFPYLRLDHFLELLGMSRRSESLYFVQIGANDGVKNDWIFPYVTRFGWNGILVEPLPACFDRLQRNYTHTTGLVFENVGIADIDGELDFYHLPDEFDDPDWLQQIGTFDRRAIEFNLAGFPELIKEVAVSKIPTLTLDSLLRRNRVERLDLLLIDAEGFEHVILKQLDTIRVRPQVVAFEWGCLQTGDLRALTGFLEARGYELFACGGDLLAVDRDRIPLRTRVSV